MNLSGYRYCKSLDHSNCIETDTSTNYSKFGCFSSFKDSLVHELPRVQDMIAIKSLVSDVQTLSCMTTAAKVKGKYLNSRIAELEVKRLI